MESSGIMHHRDTMSQYQFKIASPCHENWDAMSLQEQGRFCGVCSKEVVDFTAMTDEEVKSYFVNYKGSLCGRFSMDQLEKKDDRYFSLPAYTKKFIRAFAIVFLLFTAIESNGQTIKGEVLKGDVMYEESSGIMFRGTVYDADGVSLPDVTITFYKNGTFIKETTTIENGMYHVPLTFDRYDVVISKKGFKTKRTSIQVSRRLTLGGFMLEKSKQSEHPVLMGKIKMGKPIIKKLD